MLMTCLIILEAEDRDIRINLSLKKPGSPDKCWIRLLV